MSILLMSRVFKAPMGGASRKLLALRLADYADDEGRGIWPTVATLAAQTELSERTVQRLLADFVEEGLLVAVAEASGRRGQATRYDMVPEVIGRVSTGADGCHGVTGDTVSPVVTGDMDDATGDTSDADGCHHVTRTIREPSRTIIERERASGNADSATDGPVRAETMRARMRRVHREWPTFATDSEVAAERAWVALTDEQREAAAAGVAGYIAEARRCGRTKFCSFSTYLGEKRWERVAAGAASAAVSSHAAPAWGRAWAAARFAALAADPDPRCNMAPTRMQQQMIAAGTLSADEVRRAKLSAGGWPRVNTMDDNALHRARGTTVDAGVLALAERTEQVHRGSALWRAWAELHSQRGWPWFADAGRCAEWVYFPAREAGAGEAVADVAAAADAFLDTVRGRA